MSTTLTDPRTDLVLANADDVDHFYCEACDPDGLSVLCGASDAGAMGECPEGCSSHVECPMCADEWERHLREVHA